MTIVQLARNPVIAKLIDPTRDVAAFTTALLSYQVEATGFGGGGWSGKSSFYDVSQNTFPAGFSYLVQQELTKAGHSVNMIAKPRALPLGDEIPLVDAFGHDDPRYDYQMRALRQVEKHGAGIIRVATGGGKSRICQMIMARYRRMTLFLTTRGILLEQMDAQLRANGVNTGRVGGGEMHFVRGVNLGMVQTLIQTLEMPDLGVEMRAAVRSETAKSRIKGQNRAVMVANAQANFERKLRRREAIIKFLGMIEVVIGEEAHEAGGASYFEILQYCKNATIRVALTATPFMRAAAEDNMRLMAAFGPVLIDISEDLLIKRGILARPFFKFVNSKPHEKLRKSSPFERAYGLGYIENPFMHADIVYDAKRAAERALPVLTLVSRKKHGENLMQVFTEAGLKFEFLRGDTDMAERKTQLRALVNGEIDGVIGTSILDVGVDVPAIGLIQLAGGMKAEVSLRQRIGRGLRAKKTAANVAFIVDYSCDLNSYLIDHAKQRRGIIKATAGFVDGILPPGEDFRWGVFPLKKLSSQKAK